MTHGMRYLNRKWDTWISKELLEDFFKACFSAWTDISTCPLGLSDMEGCSMTSVWVGDIKSCSIYQLVCIAIM